MKILIVSATRFEIAPLIEKLTNSIEMNGRKITGKLEDKDIEILLTGVGPVFTAFHLGKHINSTYDLAINLGLAGSFKPEFAIGDTVNVSSDCFADIGAEDNENFLSLDELGLMDKNEPPYKEGKLFSSNEYSIKIAKIQNVNAITVNTTHGNERSIKKIIEKFNPDIESMEGAAFFYACLNENLPCLQIRSISNFVEKRDKSKWQIAPAIHNLNIKAFDLIKSL